MESTSSGNRQKGSWRPHHKLCESPALLCSAGKKRLCASISRLSAGASIPLPPIRNGAAGGARAIAQAHLPIVGLRVLSFQIGTLIALTLQHSRVWPGTLAGVLGEPQKAQLGLVQTRESPPRARFLLFRFRGYKISSDSGAGTGILSTACLSCASPTLVLLHTPHFILTTIP